MARFAGKVSIVTGSAGGIGEEYARSLAAEGAAVVVADIDGERAAKVADDIVAGGGRALGLRVDVSDPTSTAEMAADLSRALAGEKNRAVFWKDDVALAVVSTKPIEGHPIPPATASRWGWAPYLEGVHSVDRTVDAAPRPLLAGREMVATLNERRVAAGLAPVAVEKGLVGHLNVDGPANPAIFAADHRMAMED